MGFFLTWSEEPVTDNRSLTSVGELYKQHDFSSLSGEYPAYGRVIMLCPAF